MITEVNESKTLTMHISWECKCRFDGRNCDSNEKWNNDKCWFKCKKYHIWEKDCICNPATCTCENRKYLTSIMDDSVITCDEVIESYDEDAEAKSYDKTKTITTNFDEKKVTWKSQNFYILLALLLTTIVLLIVVSIYFYLIKYRTKQKYILSFRDTNSELIVPYW